MSSGLFETEPEAEAAHAGRFAQVALEQGLEKPDGLTYAVPDHLSDVRVGDRVIVPLGRKDRPVGGYVLSLSDQSDVDPRKLKPIAARDRQAVNLPDELVELARWISRYYCCPLGMVFATMLPAAVKHGKGLVKRTYVDLHDPIAAVSLTSIVQQHRLRGKQADVLGKAVELHEQGKLPVTPREIAEAAGAKSTSPVTHLVEKGFLQEVVKTELRATADVPPAENTGELTLSDDQQRALGAIARM